jgi:hypothetical protein
VNRDARGWRIALVADVLINPPPQLRTRLPDVMGAVEACGYGVLQLPPAGEHRLLLAVIADQLAEYAHHGYALVAVGLDEAPGQGLHWRRLAPLLRHRRVAVPPRHIVRSGQDAALEVRRLAALLAGYDVPESEQHHWRV